MSDPPAPGRAPTRTDVAQLAGVSGAVVSYVINNGPKRVAEPTAARVRAAIAALNYRPNAHARALSGGASAVLGLIVSDNENPFFAEFAREIEAVAVRSSRALMIGNTHGDPEIERALIEDFGVRGVDGLLVASVLGRPDRRLPAVGTAGPAVPIVWIDASRPVPGYPTVGTDSRWGARAAVEHLIGQHGYPTVGLVVGEPENSRLVDPRERGWREALRRGGRDDGPVVRAAWSREGGHAAGLSMLSGPARPRAVFAASDLQAVGLLRAARELGLDVPGDLAVIGFDGSKEAAFTWPPLTVVRQDLPAMAAAAVERVLRPAEPAALFFRPELIIRQSCGCPAG